MMDQKQHIIPQVYLKQFGYQNKNGTWKVPTINIKDIDLMLSPDKLIIKQTNIESLLRELNLYDIPILKENEKRKLEDTLKLTEDNYPSVIEEINTDKKLSPEKKQMLLAFIAFLYVRTKDFRLILEQILLKKDRTFILGVMNGDRERLIHILALPVKSAINFLIGYSGFYIFNCLQNFKIAIIKAIPSKKWATTDNPVIIKCNANDKGNIDFMGLDTKIICPISQDYLAYIDNKESNSSIYEDFEKLAENKTNTIQTSTFQKIFSELTDKERITEYLILPSEYLNNHLLQLMAPGL